jgi:NADH:ubiquinone oxidoreductase subunit 5 (subunit L)/multisubunit Na+/H+ antiporter MnhA subunit
VPAVVTTLERGYRFDEVYEESVVTPGKELGDVLRDRLEPGLVQGIVRGAVGVAQGGALGLRSVQTGLVRSYVLAMIAGTVALGAVLAWMATH